MFTSLSIVALAVLFATEPVLVPPEPATGTAPAGPISDQQDQETRDRTISVPTALIANHILRLELREVVMAGATVAVANRIQGTGGVLLPVFNQANVYFGELKVRVVTVQRLTLSLAVAKIFFKVSGSYQADFKGSALLGTFCLTADCRALASAGIWYGSRSKVEDTSPSSGTGWAGTANLIVAVGPRTALMAEGWFGAGHAVVAGGVRLERGPVYVDLGFIVDQDESLGLPWVNLGYGIGRTSSTPKPQLVQSTTAAMRIQDQ